MSDCQQCWLLQCLCIGYLYIQVQCCTNYYEVVEHGSGVLVFFDAVVPGAGEAV